MKPLNIIAKSDVHHMVRHYVKMHMDVSLYIMVRSDISGMMRAHITRPENSIVFTIKEQLNDRLNKIRQAR